MYVSLNGREEIVLAAGWNIGLTEFRRIRKTDYCSRKIKTKTLYRN